MESRQVMKSNVHRDVLRKRSTHYLEKLQKVMDASRTASQNLELRKIFIQRQNNMNYRNEYDRLHGELLGLGSPNKIKEAIHMMMDNDKLKAIGEYNKEYVEPVPLFPPGVYKPIIKTPGVKIGSYKERKPRTRKPKDFTEADNEGEEDEQKELPTKTIAKKKGSNSGSLRMP